MNGTPCCFSSIDVHQQYIREKYFPHILGIVIQLLDGEHVNTDFYQLSNKGVRQVEDCNKLFNQPNIFHYSCQHKSLYLSKSEQICKTDATFNWIDGRKSEGLNVQQIWTPTDRSKVRTYSKDKERQENQDKEFLLFMEPM